MRNLNPVLFSLIALLFLSLTATAQRRAANIEANWRIVAPQNQPAGVSVTGTIEDPDGAAIPNAKITLTAKTPGNFRTATAGGDGGFRFDSIPPGGYTLKVEAKNFVAAEKKITVIGEQPATIKMQLKVSGAEESVTVSGKSRDEEERVSIDRNADRLTLEDEFLKSLPTTGDNILVVAGNFLSPGAQGSEGVSIVVDGVETGAFSLPANSIRRLRLNRNPYSVEFRRPGKARIEALTDEGSFKRYRGRVAMYARNSVFDARNPFALTRPDLDRKLFEANLAGPLLGKRAAFFLSGERLLNDESAIVNARTLAGPFFTNVLAPERHTSLLGRVELRPKGDKHTIVLFYNHRDETERNRGVGGLRLPAQGITAGQRVDRFQFSDRAVLSPKLLNDLRVVVQRERQQRGMTANAPAIVVIGAFTGGPAQTFRTLEENSVRAQDVMSYVAGRHSLKFGGEFRPVWHAATDASNFGGTFEFSNLDRFAANAPFVFRINRGQPKVSFTQHEAFGFAQDEIKLRPNFSVTAGARYGWQQNLSDRNNLAPRLSFAYAPAKRAVVRGGVGMFYERVAEEVTRRSLLYNGSTIRETVITNPAFPNPQLPSNTVTPPPSVVRVAPDLRAPYLWQASLSIEQELKKRAQLTIEYQTLRGKKLLRSRNVNAPLAATGRRPDPNFFNLNQVESSASLRGHALGITLRGALTARLSGMAQYTYSRTKDDTGGIFALPANNYDLRPEWGRADFDQSHRFNLAGTLTLPRGFQFGTFVTLASGAPYDITTGFDNNGDSLANDRPVGFTRNTGEGPGQARVDLRVTKAVRVPRLVDRGDHSSNNLEFSVDFFNVFNRVNFDNFIGAQSSPFFGRAVSAKQARTIQFSTRYKF